MQSIMIQHSLIVGEFPGKSLAERAIMANDVISAI